MKLNTNLILGGLSGMAIAVLAAFTLNAADVPVQPRLGLGQGRCLTPEQRLARCQQIQTTVQQLRAKQAAGTITAEEQAWMNRFELGRGYCLSGQPGGPAWSLTPEQLAERQQNMQQLLADLRAKKAAGTITAEEQAWLDSVEQAGGMCVNGVPRGGGFRHGAAGLGAGRGQGRGAMGRGRWGQGAGRGICINPAIPAE